MKKTIAVALASVSLGVCRLGAGMATEPLDWVDPMIGTQTGKGEGGGMMPMTGTPFGSIQWVPMSRRTEVGRVSFECAGITNFLGFIATRQPAICMGDWGHFSLMPRVGAVECDFSKRGAVSSMEQLDSTPYRAEITAGGVRTVMSATSRAALFEIHFPDGADTPHIVIDASRDYVNGWSDKSPKDGFLEFSRDGKSVTGWNSDRLDAHHSYPLPNFKGWFVLEFSRPFVSCGTYEGSPEPPAPHRYRGVRLKDGERKVKGDVAGGWAVFAPSSVPLCVRVGVSLISPEQARENLRREIRPGETVGALSARMKEVWRERMGRLTIETADESVKRIFYTGIYHASLYPREIGEYGRYYSAFDDKVHEGESYTCYSGWDTYRAEHPLLTLVAPERVDGMMRALLQAYDEGGWLPKWPNPGYTGIMVGGPAEVMLAEAWAKGFRGFDVGKAYEAVRKNATTPQKNDRECTWRDRGCFGEFPETRAGLSWYQELGYVPCDKVYESVSRTQDFAFDDTAAAVLAEAAGAAQDAAFFRNRSHTWTNVWCAGKRMCLPKNAAGEWCAPKSGFAWHYTECIPETALWCVPHDIPLLSGLLGGDKAFADRLDRYFEENFFKPDRWRTTIHGNEPSHHVAYLYNRVGRPDKTQERVREIMARCYSATRKGFDGNEDCGQMSAWYILSAIGFYPVEPQSGRYEIGSPIVDSATLQISHPYRRAELKITVLGNSPENRYVRSVSFNGQKICGTELEHSDLMRGGELVFEMARTPGTSRQFPERKQK
ncbi:MAG: glycoside hydrolase family 92 protein [Lentisphaerae bacterium]|nr:glycoside hydrolase family 92 protein [Lentisphaerota bacterium]